MTAMMDSKELPASWYPLCRSSDLKCGEVIAATVFNVKLALFRSESGQVSAMVARCCHMGADLTNAKVIGEHLRCPLHHWEFRQDGLCARIPVVDDHAISIRQPAVICREHYGVVFGWIGLEPGFEIPGFDALDNPRLGKPHVFDFDANYVTASVNAFDQQHLKTVHHREVIGTPEIASLAGEHFSVEFRARVIGDNLYDRLLRAFGKRAVHIHIDCWGGNLLQMQHMGTPNNMMLALLPVSESKTRIFAVPVIGRPGKAVDMIAGAFMVKLLRELTMTFVTQDFDALQGMNVRLGTMLDGVDDTVMKWVAYLHALSPTDHSVWQQKTPEPARV